MVCISLLANLWLYGGWCERLDLNCWRSLGCRDFGITGPVYRLVYSGSKRGLQFWYSLCRDFGLSEVSAARGYRSEFGNSGLHGLLV